MFDAFEALLVEHAALLGKGARIALTVTDSLAAVVALPWQEELARREELHAYALDSFEQAGQRLDSTWAMNNFFRNFRRAGVGYAMPVSVLDRMTELTAANGMRLDSVLPLSAVAYSIARPAQKLGVSVLLLNEMHRVSALLFDSAGLLEYAIEPSNPNLQLESSHRLLRRLTTEHTITQVRAWSSFGDRLDEVSNMLEKWLPGIKCDRLTLDLRGQA